MAIPGLPDPAIHRKCKRCGGWFPAHEGARQWPPRVGLMSWVHVTMAESAGLEREMRFYCDACQQRNRAEERQARRVAWHLLIALGLLAGFAAVVFAFDLAPWLGGMLRPH